MNSFGMPSGRPVTLWGLFVGALSLAMATSAAAAPIVVVDTGSTGLGAPGWILSPGDWSGAEFVVGATVTITSVEGWMDISILDQESGGDVVVRIYSDGGDVPGIPLESAVFTVSGTPLSPDWHGATGLDWVLDAGTYWVTFESSTLLGSLRFAVPHPLDHYAYRIGPNWVGDDALDFGVRILGDTDVATVPEPASMALLALGLAGLAAGRRKAVAGTGDSPG